MSLQNFPTFREVYYLYGSSIKVIGTSISLANSFSADGNSPFDFIGTTKTNPLSDTKIFIQILPRVDLARFVTKNVSVKQCEFIR